MQIVIDIPEDTYKRIKFYKEFRDLNDCVITIKALENGTPLPKGHGRLIDADRLKEVFKRNIVGADAFTSLIDIAPTIIEADVQNKEQDFQI